MEIDWCEARWENAVDICSYVNRLLEQGYIVWDDEGRRITNPFVINEEGICLPLSENCSVVYFDRDKDLDGGYYTSIPEFTAQFKDWTAVHPKHAKSIVESYLEIS